MLAGVWGAGKTSIYQRVLAQLAEGGCQSLIAMPQAATITTHTYTPGSGGDHATAILSWLNALTDFLTDLDRRFQNSTLPGHRFAHAWTPTAVLEGLGFDVPVYEPPIHRDTLLDHEQRLAAIGLHLVVLHVPDELIRGHCVEGTRRHRGERWSVYLDRFGADDAARAAHIRRAQDRLLAWADTSPMPAHIIDVDRQDWDDLASRVAELITEPLGATHDQRHRSEPTPATCAGSPPASRCP
ncbi:hypothetical protein [Alloactinosynnema sp. L-07]|uniref:hypothetical protein n=1 Tax=Alloactinosynnema sp. L-07 TaxID=1653480 RepID=UPI0018D43B4E|nr:hypothetical protein [Alloactinosynnema sp. L-07]